MTPDTEDLLWRRFNERLCEQPCQHTTEATT